MLELDEDEILDYLEHHGVKGMRWGVKGAKSSSSRGESRGDKVKKALTSDTAKKAYMVTAVVGAAVAYQILKQRKATKIHSLKMDQITRTNQMTKLFDTHGKVKVSQVPKVSPKTLGPRFKSEAGSLAKLKTDLGRLYKDANADLKKGYDRSQTPLKLRNYLKTG